MHLSRRPGSASFACESPFLRAAARPYTVLRHRDYRRLLLSQFVSLIGAQMQVVAVNWHIYVLTRSPIALGFVGLTRVVPIIVFSLWGGIVADKRDRRWVMFGAQLVMAGAALSLSLLTFAGRETLSAIYCLNAISAAAWAFDNPARQALIPRLVPVEELPGALSLNLTGFHTALIAGPALAGVLIAGQGTGWLPGALAGGRAGLAWIYALNALSFLGVLVVLASLKTSGKPRLEASTGESSRSALAAGLRFVFTTPIMVWTMSLDFFATFFAGSMSLLPIFADQVLRVGPKGYGWLVAAPALGALLGSLYTSTRSLSRREGRLLLWAIVAYGVATVIYGLSRSYVLTFVALAGTGLADLVSTVIRQTLRQLLTPDELRGRMTSINMIFFMGGPQLGELEAGLVASLFATASVGITVSVVSGGLATIAAAAFVAAATRVVRTYEIRSQAA
jgi:MFS family permease